MDINILNQMIETAELSGGHKIKILETGIEFSLDFVSDHAFYYADHYLKDEVARFKIIQCLDGTFDLIYMSDLKSGIKINFKYICYPSPMIYGVDYSEMKNDRVRVGSGEYPCLLMSKCVRNQWTEITLDQLLETDILNADLVEIIYRAKIEYKIDLEWQVTEGLQNTLIEFYVPSSEEHDRELGKESRENVGRFINECCNFITQKLNDKEVYCKFISNTTFKTFKK